MLGTPLSGLTGLPRLAPESEWVVAALRARYHPEAIELVRQRSADVDWPLVMQTTRRNGVVQLIEPVIRDLDREVPEIIRGAFRLEARQIATVNLGLTRELLRLLELLDGAGIDALPYKGPVLAQVVYGDIGLRRFGDLDILVRRRDVRRTIQLLASDGYRSGYSLTPRQMTALIRTGHDWHLDRADRSVVEVQWAVANHEHMLPRGVEPLIDRASSVRLAGRDVPTLDPTDQVVVLAMHGGIHLFSRLAWVCDMAEAISNVPGADLDRAMRIAEGAHARRLLLFALAMVDRVLDLRPAPDLSARACEDPLLERVLDDLLPAILAPGGPDHRSPHVRVSARSLLADGRIDAVRGLWRATVTATPSDYAAVRLPDAVRSAYSLVRLGRLIRFYAGGGRRSEGLDVFDGPSGRLQG